MLPWKLDRKHYWIVFLVISVIFTSVVIPLILYFQIGDVLKELVEFKAYLLKLDFLILPIVLVGFIIISLSVLIYFFEPYMYCRLIFSVASEVVYIIQIILISPIFDVYFNYGQYFIRINISKLYWFLIIIPVLIIIKNVYNFYFMRKSALLKFFVLRIVKEFNGPSNKAKMRRFINKQENLPNRVKMYVLRNLSKLIREMEQDKNPLIRINNGKYFPTKDGQKIIDYFNKTRKILKVKLREDDTANLGELDVWTEKQLRKYSKKREKNLNP